MIRTRSIYIYIYSLILVNPFKESLSVQPTERPARYSDHLNLVKPVALGFFPLLPHNSVCACMCLCVIHNSVCMHACLCVASLCVSHSTVCMHVRLLPISVSHNSVCMHACLCVIHNSDSVCMHARLCVACLCVSVTVLCACMHVSVSQ